MKKLLAVMLTALLLCVSVPAYALTLPEAVAPEASLPHFGGYVAGDFNGNDTGRFIGFNESDPSEYVTYTVCLSTYAAAYCDGFVCGYVFGYDDNGELHDDYYRINAANGVIEFIEGASSGGEFVYGMAYNYADGGMYALCDEDHPYIARVDTATGALTRCIDIELGTLLGVQSFAIDGDGNFYVLTFAAISSKLMRVDPVSGSLTQIMDTGLPNFYAQSMTWDPLTGCLFWAHVNERTSSTNGLYRIDLDDNSIDYCGMIGGGMEITCLYSTASGEAPQHYMRGDVNNDGAVDSTDALLALRASMDLITLDPLAVEVGDIDGDGTVSAADSLLILRYAMELTDTL